MRQERSSSSERRFSPLGWRSRVMQTIGMCFGSSDFSKVSLISSFSSVLRMMVTLAFAFEYSLNYFVFHSSPFLSSTLLTNFPLTFTEEFALLSPFQKVNYMPGTAEICRFLSLFPPSLYFRLQCLDALLATSNLFLDTSGKIFFIEV